MSKDGGQAFPHFINDCGVNVPSLDSGITKLEYFAGEALKGLLANDIALSAIDQRAQKNGQCSYDVAARDAFHYAEAMLAESERRSKS